MQAVIVRLSLSVLGHELASSEGVAMHLDCADSELVTVRVGRKISRITGAKPLPPDTKRQQGLYGSESFQGSVAVPGPWFISLS